MHSHSPFCGIFSSRNGSNRSQMGGQMGRPKFGPRTELKFCDGNWQQLGGGGRVTPSPQGSHGEITHPCGLAGVSRPICCPAWCPCWLQGRADHLRLAQHPPSAFEGLPSPTPAQVLPLSGPFHVPLVTSSCPMPTVSLTISYLLSSLPSISQE